MSINRQLFPSLLTSTSKFTKGLQHLEKNIEKTKTKESMLIHPKEPQCWSAFGHDQLASLFVTDARRGGAKSFGAIGDGLFFGQHW
jgi:bifunctional pyridoxal-dependent enzyme with beta-cystathionase and maltose regulon repressor activities